MPTFQEMQFRTPMEFKVTMSGDTELLSGICTDVKAAIYDSAPEGWLSYFVRLLANSVEPWEVQERRFLEAGWPPITASIPDVDWGLSEDPRVRGNRLALSFDGSITVQGLLTRLGEYAFGGRLEHFTFHAIQELEIERYYHHEWWFGVVGKTVAGSGRGE